MPHTDGPLDVPGIEPRSQQLQLSVLFLIPSLQGGGAERVITTLLRHLDRTRFRLALAVVDLRQAAYIQDLPSDVELIDLACTRVRYALPKIARLIRSRRPDVVFSTLGHLNLALAMMRRWLPGDTIYIARETSLVSELLRGYGRPRLWAWAYRHFYGRFDVVVCQSRAMLDDLSANFGFPAERGTVIHNPIDVGRIRRLAAVRVEWQSSLRIGGSQPRQIRLVAAGRMAPEKGFDLLIEAIALCDNPSIILTLLGDGPLLPDLRALALARGVENQIQFVGFQTNPYPYFAQADLYVLSSRFEGFPNVVLEALACGTPVVATPAPGGVREILGSMDSCIIAEAVSSAALANAIQRWMARNAQDSECREAVAQYSIEQILPAYERLLAKYVRRLPDTVRR